MVVKRADSGDAPGWPAELWFFEKSGFRCRHTWLCACADFAAANGYRRLPIIKLMTNRRPLGAELATELTPECRERVRRPPINGHGR